MAHQRPNSFLCILQSEFDTEQSTWSYNVNNLPGTKATNPGRWVKSINLVASPEIQKLELKFIKVEQNRATTSQQLDHLIHFSFLGFHLGQIVEGHWQKCTHKETGDYVARLLKHGIILNGLLYSFFGHSNSQLKSRSCYLLRGPKDKVAKMVESLGDFSRIKTVAKKAKRIGLLFSSCNAVMQVPDDRYEDIDDIIASGYNFTDGCGMIGRSTARILSQKLSIIIYNKHYHPSVFQIRFKGYKGVVSEEPQMRKGCWFQFRSSMRKFTGTTDPSFAVVEYSQPYTYGYLNDDIVLLLHALGISKEVLLRKQQEHLGILRSSLSDPVTAFILLCSLGRLDLVEKLVLGGIETITSSLHGLIIKEYTKMLNKKDEKKCRILVPNSRLLFGICDSRSILEEGECFLRVTDETSGGLPRTIRNCEVLVTRNPCLHPGDLRKFKAVDRPELAHLKDCIVFAVKGERPAADQMSGGDLDGDKFFVCWDPDLIPSIISEPAEYPPGPDPLSFSSITVDNWIEYFARYTSASLGRVKNLFLEWAIHKGALSRECQELNRLHSLCVDGNRISIPDRLANLPPRNAELGENFILNVLHAEATKSAQTKLSVPAVITGLGSRDVIETILCQPRTCSEFSMICLAHDWCVKTGQVQLCDLLPYFDLSAITAEQQAWLLQALPPSIDYPSLVMNRLLSSDILAPDELTPFHLDFPGIRWKCIFSANDRIANLFEAFEQSFPQFHRKLLVLKIHERLTVAIYIPQQISPEEEASVGGRVRAIAFPHTQERDNQHGCVHSTKATYRLYYDRNTFQLYEVARRNTFIWIGRPGKADGSYRSVKGSANRARERQKTIVAGVNHDWVASIALNRFSQHVRTQIGRVYRDGIAAAELYVISNTDLESFRNLDLWMQSIDTMEVIPLFERVPPPLTIPRLSDADLSSHPMEVRRLLERGDISALEQPELHSNITSVLQICFEHGETGLPAKIYEYYLQSSEAIATWVVPEELLEALVQGLMYTPVNVVFFARLTPWKENFCDTLYRSLRAKGVRLLKATIQAANAFGSFAMEAIRSILRELDSLSLESLQEIVEHMCLLSRSPRHVLDIYLDTLEMESERLLTECPAAKRYFMRNMISIAIEHCEEAAESTSGKDDLWTFEPFSHSSAPIILTSYRRLDAPQLARLAAGDHVRFELAKYPVNVLLTEKPTFDAIIKSSQRGSVEFRCLTCPPAYNVSARWRLKHCGSFVTSKAMLDSLVALIRHKVEACALYPLLVENKALQNLWPEGATYEGHSSLNQCQNLALEYSLSTPLTCIWGPPGTGKTQTVAILIQEILWRRPDDRLLVTAPTHNAVDNILKRYLQVVGATGTMPLRVTTNLRKVDSGIVKYACDGMERTEVGQSSSASRSQAVKRIQQARLIFTTCAGAGLGLLRNESFQIVIIDEASQQTEPLSLIPLTKGCQKAILVGDHVQLRATVHKYAKILDFDISLFERLYTDRNIPEGPLRRVMLDIQYRMHSQICEFPSQVFYEGKLKAHASCDTSILPENIFPWPKMSSSTGDLARCVLVPCSGEEDVGHQSKGNPTQAQLCKEVYRLVVGGSASIAILTPYTRQVQILKDCLPSSATISSIDGFQGQEADIVLYVTVRCNPHGDIGFLNDLRRLNVVLTRARAGLIVIGDPRTLTNVVCLTSTGQDAAATQLDPLSFGSRNVDQDGGPVWKRLVQSLHRVDIPLPSQ